MRSTVLLWYSENRIIAPKVRRSGEKEPLENVFGLPSRYGGAEIDGANSPNNAFRLGFKGAGERFWKRRWRRVRKCKPTLSRPKSIKTCKNVSLINACSNSLVGIELKSARRGTPADCGVSEVTHYRRRPISLLLTDRRVGYRI